MSKTMTAPHPHENPHCTEPEVDELCEAMCRLGYPSARRRSAVEALRHASLRRYRAGDVVIREGARSREVYVVRGGKLKVSQGARHEEHSMTLLPGDIVGEIGALHHVPRTATVKAERDSELFRIDDKTFDLLLRSSPEFRHVMEATAHVRRLGLD